MLLGGILEFVLGNTFASAVYCSYAGFWLSLGGTIAPFGGAEAPYVKDGVLGLEFFNAFGWFPSYTRPQSRLPGY